MVVIDGTALRCADVMAVSRRYAPVELNPDAVSRATRSWELGKEVAARRPVYGRTTGVGSNRNVAVEDEHGASHGLRLLRSHAGGAGPLLADELVRAMLVVRLNQLAAGGSGVHPDVLSLLARMLNEDALPQVHTYGGIGTGDLTALAETALTVIGERPWGGSGDALPRFPFESADALAFISSNAATLGEAALAAEDLRGLATAGLVVAALSFEAVDGNSEAYAAAVHVACPHPGAVAVSATMRSLLGPVVRDPARIQDPFGFRAIPQVCGPVLDSIEALDRVLTVQLSAAAENPLVSLRERDVLHHGGFHTAYVALALDTTLASLAQGAVLVIARMASLAEPAFTGTDPYLASGPAGSSGTMILEYTAASALAELRMCASPAALGTVVLSRGLEEDASFSTQAARQATAAVRAYRVMVGCELVMATRALRLRGVAPTSEPLRVAYERACSVLDPSTEDRDLTPDVTAAQALLPDLAAAAGGPVLPRS
jgi:histidine ammonia-lyase